MTPEHEKLLSQLFVTWDVTDGVGVRDFGFVQCQGSPHYLEFSRAGGKWGYYSESCYAVEAFEEVVGVFLKRLVTNEVPLSERSRLDSIEFDLGCGRIRAPGPIGLLVVNNKPKESWYYSRILVAFPERFEVISTAFEVPRPHP